MEPFSTAIELPCLSSPAAEKTGPGMQTFDSWRTFRGMDKSLRTENPCTENAVVSELPPASDAPPSSFHICSEGLLSQNTPLRLGQSRTLRVRP